MNLSYVQMLLEVLKNNMFKKLKKVEQYNLEKVDYYQWDKEITGDQTSLETGIGGLDEHYQLAYTLNCKDYINNDKRNSLCLKVETSDEDMWDTSNPQFIVSINGKVTRALDMNHNYVLLPPTEEQIDILMNVYTNTEKPDVFIESWLCSRVEPIFSLYYQLKAILESAQIAEIENQHSNKVDRILERISVIIDLTNVNHASFLEDVEKCLEELDEWYEELDDSDADIIVEHIVGHTHIDLSWFWTLKQTREKVVRSFSNAIYLMEKYPQMTFMSSTPVLYEMLEEEDPALFDKVSEYINNGRWETEGSMYVESDINLPTGEALIRQILLGKKYFRSKFNKENKILWLPDCFGFSASLPQIMKKSGIDYFFTSKMDWSEVNQMPNDTFMWKGIDGSEVLAYFLTTSDYSEDSTAGTTYNGRLNASQVKGTWKRYRNKSLTSNTLQLYGFGDGGGGPTEEMLEYSNTFEHRIPNMPVVKHSTPLKFFEELNVAIQNKEVPTWDGELYLETHRGVLTTDGYLKKINRESEVLLMQAEFICSILLTTGIEYPHEKLEKAWEKILVNQFHDILPGTSSNEVHEEAILRYEEAQEISREIIGNGIQELGWDQNKFDEKMIAINTTSFERDLLISDDNKDYFVEKVPAFGFKVFEPLENIANEEETFSEISEDNKKVENIHYMIKINEYGELSSVYSKALNRELVEENESFNQLILYPDLPKEFDAWNIDEHSLSNPKHIKSKARIELVDNTEFRTVVKIQRKINNSVLTQHLTFYQHSERIDFETQVDWQENHVLARVKFPTKIKVGKATYDIQFGNIERNNHSNTSWDKAKFEVCAHKWADLSEQSYGISILNNGKYGHSIQQNNMFVSLLRSPQYPAEDIDKGLHEFTYSLFPHIGTFRDSDVYKEAYDLNNPFIVAGKVDDREVPIYEKSYFNVDTKNIIIESIKQAENNEKSLVIRLYESEGKSTETNIGLGFEYTSWNETDLMENNIGNVSNEDLTLTFEPYEIKTIKVNIIN